MLKKREVDFFAITKVFSTSKVKKSFLVEKERKCHFVNIYEGFEMKIRKRYFSKEKKKHIAIRRSKISV